MLVLSRRLNERIVIPSIEATIEVVAVKPGAVRLGFRAPAQVRFLREEMAGIRMPVDLAPAPTPAATPPATASRRDPLLRTELGNLGLDLALIRAQVQSGDTAAAQLTLDRVERGLQMLLDHQDREKHPPTEAGPDPARITATCATASVWTGL